MLVIIASSDEDKSRERRVIDSLVSRRVSGLVVVPIGSDHRYLAREIATGWPSSSWTGHPGTCGPTPSSWTTPGGRGPGVSHLIVAGHRRIGLLTDDLGVYTMSERFDGYRQALEDAGLPFDPSLARHDCHDVHDARAATLALLGGTPPTAIFGTNNRMSVGAISAITTRGIASGSSASTTSSSPPRSSRRSRSCEPTTRPWAGSARSCCSAAWTAGTAIHSASCCRPRSCHGARASSLPDRRRSCPRDRGWSDSHRWDDSRIWMTT